MVGVFSMVGEYGNGDTITSLKKFSEEVKRNQENTSNRGKEQVDKRWVELFFSFDVVNSTLYKTVNYFGWSKILSELFHELQRKVVGEIQGAEIWRVLGDEIIFVKKMKSINEIYESVRTVFKILTESVLTLKNGDFFDNVSMGELDTENIELMKLQNVISLQGSAWIAIIRDDNSENIEPYDNIFEKYKASSEYEINEYLGNDIDAGFRVKKYTQDRRLAVSFELACILAERTAYLSNLNIITYKKLKGIWNESLYPIIWFHDARISNGIKFSDSFYYDEYEKSELAREYFDNRLNWDKDQHKQAMFADVNKVLQKIQKDRGLVEKITCIKEQISSSDSIREFKPSFLLQLHCVAVCCDMANERILIAKRSKGRGMLSEKWEFGCAKAKKEENIAEQIKLEYKEDFNIDIEVIVDSKRQDRQPIPLAMYEVADKDGSGKHKGVITIAKIMGEYNPDNAKLTEKHQQVRWISRNEIDIFEDDAVSDFKDTLRKVFDWLEQNKEKSDGSETSE